MIPLTLNNKEYLLAEVMDKATVIPVLMGYKSIGHTKDLTEEQAASMVEKWDSGWFNDYQYHLSKCETALESFHSFLRSHGVDETRNYLILEKI